MDVIHKEVLDIHHERLVTSLKANDVIDSLLRENAINKYDYDQLKRTQAQGARAVNRLLLLTLRQRGAGAFPAFQRSLQDSHQGDLHHALKSAELDLLEGVLTERLQRSEGRGSAQLSSAGVLGYPYDFSQPLPDPALQERERPDSADSGDSRSRQHGQPAPAHRRSASPSSPRQKQESEKDRQLKQLEEEVQELRRSHSKMETELRLQKEQLEKDKGAGGAKNKEGGCAVM